MPIEGRTLKPGKKLVAKYKGTEYAAAVVRATGEADGGTGNELR